MLVKDTDNRKWEVLEREYLFRRPWLTARKDVVKLPNGNIIPEFYVLEYPDWVNVIAITTDEKFVMIRQYRHGLGETRYELCAGVVDPGEDPLTAAKRELYEETGYGKANGKRFPSFLEIRAQPITSPTALSQKEWKNIHTALGIIGRHHSPHSHCRRSEDTAAQR